MADDAEPTVSASGERTADAAGGGAFLPRLTQFSSLGSRVNAGRGPAAPSSTVDAPVDSSAGDRFDEDFARHGGASGTPAADVVAPLAPAGPPAKHRFRHGGSRGALGVVGLVGLLAGVGVVLTLALIGGHEDGMHDGSSGTARSDGHGRDGLDGHGGPTTPSASTSSTATSKKSDGSDKSPSASTTTGASGKASASPAGHAAPSTKSTTKAGTTAPAASPGVNVFSHTSQRCIDIVGGKAVPGARLMIWDCSESASQHWTFSGGTMRTLGMCVELAGGSTADGTDLEMASCDGSPEQRFALNARHDLASALADKCADVRDDQTANGTRIQLWSCSGTDNQKWSRD